MVTVGIRELKQQTSRLLRMVRESGQEVRVTYHGRVVAFLIPAIPRQKRNRRAWADIDDLAKEIGARWPKNVSAAEAIAEARR